MIIRHTNTDTETYHSWSQKIGVFDGVLTLDECDELIAVHASEAHRGYIDRLEVTRVSDLVVGEGDIGTGTGTSSSTPSSTSLPLALPLLRARYKMWERIEEFFPETNLEVVPEYTALTSWHAGAFLRMHYDSNKEYLKDRHYSAVLYLNDPDPSEDDNDNDNDNGDNTQQHKSSCRRRRRHPDNYHRSGFSGGDLVFEVPNAATTVDIAAANGNATATVTSTKRIRARAGRLVCFPSSSDYVHGVEEIKHNIGSSGGGTRYALTMWFTNHHDAMESLESLQQAYFCRQQQQTNTAIRNGAVPTSSHHHRYLHLLQQQPWETPKQAIELRFRAIRRAGIPKSLPLSPRPRTCGEERPKHSIDPLKLSEKELLHLIAHCWWKKGLPLGDLLESATQAKVETIEAETNVTTTTAAAAAAAAILPTIGRNNTQHEQPWTLEGGLAFTALVSDWKKGYLPRRSRGLASALERWMKHECGLITSVRDDEME
jgi:hypothetical protein